MAGIRKRLGSLLGPEGRVPEIIETRTTQVAPGEPANVDLVKTGDAQYRMDVRVPRGLDGDPNAVADLGQAMAAEINTEGTIGHAALAARIEQRAVTGVGVTRIVASFDPFYPLEPGELLVLLKESRRAFFYDFSEYPLGLGVPEGWVEPWHENSNQWEIVNDDTVSSGRVLQNNGSLQTLRRLLVPFETQGAARQNADQEVVLKHKRTGSYDRGILRATGNSGTENALWAGNNGPNMSSGQYLNGSVSSYGNHSRQDDDEWKITRLRVEGATLYTRHWTPGDPEPSEWTHIEHDLPITEVGDVGILASAYGRFAWVGFGFDGETAPKGPAL